MSNKYETMYIIRPDLTEDQVTQETKKYEAFLQERNVENLTIRNHGKKRLAYNIGKHQDGIYVQMNYQIEGDVISQLQRQMRLSENVIRFLTLTVDEIPESTAEIPSTPTVTPQTEPEPAPETAATEEETEEAAAAPEDETATA
ncbi:SSU ribosomal protein S6P [Halothece sp. PCC 7418]|uniref:30S ribosomal protein S6 n=1 Tax=Halothece sp. (strain PCC 7418) TaxID=65093 RepID=UPI0002A07468|nr:30S ribosomal protein S6 [Halothece sp. PCC 7418]AFZ43665.1 SSU ribosomal protein S6P [Halothece sp. PCC 7418]